MPKTLGGQSPGMAGDIGSEAEHLDAVVEFPSPKPGARRWLAWCGFAIALLACAVVARYFVLQCKTREEIWRLAQLRDPASVSWMASLARQHPECWSRDLEVVEAIAAVVDTHGVGYWAERALQHAEVGGPSWRRAIVRTLKDDLIEFDDALVRSAVATIRKQPPPLDDDVVGALSQRLRWACQDRDKDLPEYVQEIARVLAEYPEAYTDFRRSLLPIEISWLDKRSSR